MNNKCCILPAELAQLSPGGTVKTSPSKATAKPASEPAASQSASASQAEQPKRRGRPKKADTAASEAATAHAQAAASADINEGKGKRPSPTKRKARPKSPARLQQDAEQGSKPPTKKASPGKRTSAGRNASDGSTTAACSLDFATHEGNANINMDINGHTAADHTAETSGLMYAAESPQREALAGNDVMQLPVPGPEPLMTRLHRLAAAGPASAALGDGTSSHGMQEHPISSSPQCSPTAFTSPFTNTGAEPSPELSGRQFQGQPAPSPSADLHLLSTPFTVNAGMMQEAGAGGVSAAQSAGDRHHAAHQGQDAWDDCPPSHFMDYEPTPVKSPNPYLVQTNSRDLQQHASHSPLVLPDSLRGSSLAAAGEHPSVAAGGKPGQIPSCSSSDAMLEERLTGCSSPDQALEITAHALNHDLEPWLSHSKPETPLESSSPSVILLEDTPTPTSTPGRCRSSRQAIVSREPPDHIAAKLARWPAPCNQQHYHPKRQRSGGLRSAGVQRYHICCSCFQYGRGL